MSQPARTGRSPLAAIRNLRIAAKINMLAAVLVAGMLVLIGVAWTSLNSVNAASVSMTNAVTGVTDLSVIEQDAVQAQLLVAQIGAAVNPKDEAGWKAQFAQNDTELAKYEGIFTKDFGSTPGWAQFRTAWANFLAFRASTLMPAAMAANSGSSAQSHGQSYEELALGTEARLVKAEETPMYRVIAEQQAKVNALSKTVSSTKSRAVTLLVVAGVISIVLALMLARWISSLVTRPVKRVQESLAAVAGGDLTKLPDVNTTDEIGSMAASLTTTITNLRDMIGHVVESSGVMVSATETLASTSEMISSSAEETSSQSQVVAAAADQVSRNVQTVAAGSEEMGASIREIAQNAAEAARVAPPPSTPRRSPRRPCRASAPRRPRSATSSR